MKIKVSNRKGKYPVLTIRIINDYGAKKYYYYRNIINIEDEKDNLIIDSIIKYKNMYGSNVFKDNEEIVNYIFKHKKEFGKFDDKMFKFWLILNNIDIEYDNKEDLILKLNGLDSMVCSLCGCDNKLNFKNILGSNIYDCYDKFCSDACLNKWRSDNMLGSENAFFRTPKETLEKVWKNQSILMKKRIRDGEFTPCITNTWTHYDSIINIKGKDKKMRSSWEAFFYLCNEDLEYEKVRIPYTYLNDDKIYITDFVDYENRIIYEIKPNSEVNTDKNIAKKESAIKWCKENGYVYKLITNKWFIDNKQNIKYLLSKQENNKELIKKLERIK